jgi:hypothetical protein
MLGGSCSPCCAGLPHVGRALSGWGASFHGWNTVSTSYSTTLFGSTWHTIESYLAENAWTVLGERYERFRSLSPYAQFGSYSYFFGPQWSTVDAYRTSSTMKIQVVLNHKLLRPHPSLTGQRTAIDVTSTIVYEKPIAGFWETKLESGTFIFSASDVVSFSSVATPTALIPDTSGLAALQSDVGSLAIIQRPILPSGVAWTKPFSFPIEIVLQCVQTTYSVPIGCSSDQNTFYFHVGTGIPVQATVDAGLCFNTNTAQVVSARIGGPTSVWLPIPPYSDANGLTGKPSGTAILFLVDAGGATIWNVPSDERGSPICAGRTLRTFGSCFLPGLRSDLPVAGCAVHQAYWEAFSNDGSVTIPCNGRDVFGHPFPGSTFGYTQPGFNTDATFTVRMI